MPSALSVDLRERVVAAIEAGASQRQAAQRFGVGATSTIRWHERYRHIAVRDHEISAYLERGFLLRMRGERKGQVNLIAAAAIVRED